MKRPIQLSPRSDNRFLNAQRRLSRGLQTRAKKLVDSWANDADSLAEQRDALAVRYCQLRESLSHAQLQARHESIEAWDEELDSQIEFAEKSLLLSLRTESENLKKLQVAFDLDQQAAVSKRDAAISAANKSHEEGKATAVQSRDKVKTRVETERRTLENNYGELSEWLLLKTGKPLSRESVAQVSPPIHSGESEPGPSLGDLSSAAKNVDQKKNKVAESIQAIQQAVQGKRRLQTSIVAVSPLICILAAVVAWMASVPIVFCVLIAFVGSLLFSAGAYFAVRPVLAKAALRLTPTLNESADELVVALQQALRIADGNFKNDLVRVTNNHEEELRRVEEEYQAKSQELSDALERNKKNESIRARRRRYELSSGRSKKFESIDMKWRPALESQESRFHEEAQSLTGSEDLEIEAMSERFATSQKFCIDRWQRGIAYANQFAVETAAFLDQSQPSWSDPSYGAGSWVRDSKNLIWRIGSSPVSDTFLQRVEACDPALRMDAPEWPVAFDLLSEGALILHTSENLINGEVDPTEGLLNDILLRSVTSLPAGTIRYTIIDPQGLGKKFSWLMALADVDGGLVGDRVWTQPTHIADRLANIARECEDIIQQSLRNNYANLFEYNKNAGPMTIPYRMIVWDHFPAGLDEHSWDSLCSILSAGGRCGVGVVLRMEGDAMLPSFVDRSKLNNFGRHLHLVDGAASEHAETTESGPSYPNDRAKKGRLRLSQKVAELGHAPVYLSSPPSSEVLREVMEHHLEHVAELGRVIVPFDSIVQEDYLQEAHSSADGLNVPIGIAASGRVHSMKLGHGTSQHVLVAGKTGSGKSSLLHTMITSASLKYSPDELRLILLDFKKGVEFQVYSEAQLPHADIIGIESKREFGVSTLEYVDRIMTARGEAFRGFGVQDLPSLNRKYPDEVMPRILIVIDEFQELFVEDDKLTQQAAMLMDRIVRQGRSFGIHLVLASQTLGGAYSLPRTTLAQMAVRIALQCDPSDAMLILGEDNTAAERLRFSGQAIYNEAGGRVESNQGFQVAYIDKETQLSKLEPLPRSVVPDKPTINPLGRQIVFEGHKPAVWEDEPMRRLLEATLNASYSTAAPFPCVLGESVSIDPPVVSWLPRQAGRHICVVGAEEELAASLLASLVQGASSYLSNLNAGSNPGDSTASASTDRLITIYNGARSEDASISQVIEKSAHLSSCQVVQPRELEKSFATWKDELQKRIDAPEMRFPTRILCVANLAKFRELRKGDEFGFGDSDGSAQPDVVLSELLKDGPAVGIHLWMWADSANTLTRWLSRQSIRELELRILMQMSGNDSNSLIDSSAASKLDRQVMLFQDEMVGTPVRIRPFAWKTLPLFS